MGACLTLGPDLERFAEPDAFVPFRLVLPWWVPADMARAAAAKPCPFEQGHRTERSQPMSARKLTLCEQVCPYKSITGTIVSDSSWQVFQNAVSLWGSAPMRVGAD